MYVPYFPHWLEQIVSREAETACELQLDFSEDNLRNAELANKNLHIWEVAQLFELFPTTASGVNLRLLAPNEIVKIAKNGAVSKKEDANVIAALNGPMAHLYVKGSDGNWTSEPDQITLKLLLNRLNSVLKKGKDATGNAGDKINTNFHNLASSIDAILFRGKRTDSYSVVDSISEDAAGNIVINYKTPSEYFTDGHSYVDAVNRLSGLNEFNRSGDIVLIMKDHTTGTQETRYTTGVACKSWHGSLNPSDSFVPFIVAYPGGNKTLLEEISREVCTSSNCGGNWILPEFIKSTVIRQYQEH